jgi:hypothetical protein
MVGDQQEGRTMPNRQLSFTGRPAVIAALKIRETGGGWPHTSIDLKPDCSERAETALTRDPEIRSGPSKQWFRRATFSREMVRCG